MDILDFGAFGGIMALATILQVVLVVVLVVLGRELFRFLRAANRVLPGLERWLERQDGSR